MHFEPNSLPFGVVPTILIDCAKQLAHKDSFSFDGFCRALGATRSEGKTILAAVIAGGLVAPNEQDADQYEGTQLFRQVSLARIGEGLPRAEAERLLERVLDVARSINANPAQHECTVLCIVVFGSFLGDKPLLGDLDLGVAIEEIRQSGERPGYADIRKLLAAASPTSKAMSALRMRKPKLISVHKLSEVLELRTPYRVVFGELPKNSPSFHLG